MSKIDQLFIMLIFLMALVASFMLGQEMTKKSYCEKSGNYWSYDYGRCFTSLEVLK